MLERKTKHISIAYATLNDYQYTLISMISILQSASSDTFCDFAILIDDTFEENSKNEMRRHLEEYQKYSLTFYHVGKVFDKVMSHVDFIKNATFFRLLLPQILKVDKCLYLDADTIICEDLCQLFNMSLENNYLAGVKAPAYFVNHDCEEYCKQAKISDLEHYVNAGVLLMNLKKMKADNLVPKFLELIPHDMVSQDQDIINSVCYGKITFLPFSYNVMTKYANWPVSQYEGVFEYQDIQEAWNSPKIIHYADRIKPWKDLECVMGDFWWNICKNSSLWEYFYLKLDEQFFRKAFYTYNNPRTAIRKNVPVLFDFKQYRKTVVFGAGIRAKKFLDFMFNQGLKPEYIVVSNTQNNPSQIMGINVIGLDELEKKNRDKTVIIATLERYHAEIINSLLAYDFKEIIPISEDLL